MQNSYAYVIQVGTAADLCLNVVLTELDTYRCLSVSPHAKCLVLQYLFVGSLSNAAFLSSDRSQAIVLTLQTFWLPCIRFVYGFSAFGPLD